MNYEELVKLIDKLDQSSVAYVEFNQGVDRIVVAKEVPQGRLQERETIGQPAAIPVKPTELLSVDSTSTDEIKVSSNEEVVLSPLVGVAYLQSKPDSPSFVSVGDTVTKGQTVCIVEAMKLMNEIVAPVSGVVTEILVENESVVEFNQPLMKIETK